MANDNTRDRIASSFGGRGVFYRQNRLIERLRRRADSDQHASRKSDLTAKPLPAPPVHPLKTAPKRSEAARGEGLSGLAGLPVNVERVVCASCYRGRTVLQGELDFTVIITKRAVVW